MTPVASGIIPIYKKIAQQLREQILKGTYPVGHNLPTEKQLAEDFQSSRHTIREALRDLRQDGVIASRQGSGSVVCVTPNDQSFVHETSTINEIEQYAHNPIKIFSNTIVVLDSDLCKVTPIDDPNGWMLIEGYRYSEGTQEPICATQAFLHPEFLGVARLFGKRATPLFELIEENFGVVIHEVEQRIRTCKISENMAIKINLLPDSIAIEVQRFYKLKDGKVVEISRNIYPPENFHFSMKLKRHNRRIQV